MFCHVLPCSAMCCHVLPCTATPNTNMASKRSYVQPRLQCSNIAKWTKIRVPVTPAPRGGIRRSMIWKLELTHFHFTFGTSNNNNNNSIPNSMYFSDTFVVRCVLPKLVWQHASADVQIIDLNGIKMIPYLTQNTCWSAWVLREDLLEISKKEQENRLFGISYQQLPSFYTY